MSRQDFLLTAALALAIAGASTSAAGGFFPASISLAAGPASSAGNGDGGGAIARNAVDVNRLALQAPGLDVDVLALALKAMHCAQRGGIAPGATRLAVIDYSLPSRQERLWLFDLEAGTLLMRELVAHGRNSGDDMATSFSNVEGSLQTSLGLFVTGATYQGSNGYSLRMEGLEPGINDQAMARAIVMHGAPYVNPAAAEKQGRLGRSWGCPAVRPEISRQMIDDLRDGQFLFAYYPEQAWLQKSALLACEEAGSATEAIASH